MSTHEHRLEIRARHAAPPRYVHTGRDGTLSLLEVADGDPMWIGPQTDHAEVEALAQSLLGATGPGTYIPVTLHKLCLAYLAARQVERVA